MYHGTKTYRECQGARAGPAPRLNRLKRVQGDVVKRSGSPGIKGRKATMKAQATPLAIASRTPAMLKLRSTAITIESGNSPAAKAVMVFETASSAT